VSLCQSCAQGFNPLGSPTDEAPEHAGLAIDNNENTVWDTQHYYDNKLDKAGTGIYVQREPGGGRAAATDHRRDAPGSPPPSTRAMTTRP